jgi:lysozyme
MQGIDISEFSGKISWDQASASGLVRFVYSRVCQGASPVEDDAAFAANHDACKQRSIPFGCWMFYDCAQDGVAQANHFLAAANQRYGTLKPAVYIEQGSVRGAGGSADARVANLAAFSKVVTSGLVQPIIFTNFDTWRWYFGNSDAFADHKLWVANYTTPGDPSIPSGWHEWTLHQYTSSGSVPGIVGNVDLNVLNGDDISTILQ